jgi:hypothetical protein
MGSVDLFLSKAGEAAANLAELLWDDSDEPPRKPGPSVTIRVREMPIDEFEALEEP